jgi:hypothetical protein
MVRIVIFVISVSSHPLRSMPLLYVLEEHSAAAHVAQFFHACK